LGPWCAAVAAGALGIVDRASRDASGGREQSAAAILNMAAGVGCAQSGLCSPGGLSAQPDLGVGHQAFGTQSSPRRVMSMANRPAPHTVSKGGVAEQLERGRCRPWHSLSGTLTLFD
jgi:hypothetical protein